MTTDGQHGRSRVVGEDFSAVQAALYARGFTRMAFDISRMHALLDLLGSPQRAFPAIHITGTNGKTSTARMIDSVLGAYGLRTGRYTSPHLETVRERISIAGAPIDTTRFVEVYREVAPAVRLLDDRDRQESLTFFDVTTAMAFAAFADAPVDVGIVEVGLGGAEDSTNVLQADISVITPIGLDHTEWLGESLEEIATAKAGIVHKGSTLVCASQPDEAMRPILERCLDVEAAVTREGHEFGVIGRELAVGGQVLALQGLGGIYDGIILPLHGMHQAQNACVALAAVESFLGAGAGSRQLDPDVVRAGFAAATSPGRLERVRTSPTILLDAAHNPHGMGATVAALLQEFSFARLVAVLGVLTDKDATGMLELLEPVVDAVVCARSTSTRAMPAERLGGLAREIFGDERVRVVPSLPDAIDAAVAWAETDVAEVSGAGVLITGSVVTVADARAMLVR